MKRLRHDPATRGPRGRDLDAGRFVEWPGGTCLDAGHLRALAELEARAFAHAWSRSQLTETLELETTTTFAWLDDQAGKAEVFAYACFQRVLDEAELLRLAVAPELRRRGLGSSMLETALERLNAVAPLRYCLLEVAANNRPAIRLYEDFGFRLEGRRRGYYSQTQTYDQEETHGSEDVADGAAPEANDALLYRYTLPSADAEGEKPMSQSDPG